MTPGAAGTASYRTRGETVTQDETDATARLAEALRPLGEPWPGAPSPEVVAAALLPVVRVLQAEELEAAATGIGDWPGVRNTIRGMLRARAAALRGEAGR